MKKSGYYIDTDKKVNYECFCGPTVVEDFIAQKEELVLNPAYDFYNPTLFDVRDSDLQLCKDDLIALELYFRKFEVEGKERRIAFLVESPVHTIQAMRFTKIMKESASAIDYQPNSFSTLEAALQWLDVKDLSLKEAEQALNQLKLKCTNASPNKTELTRISPVAP